MSSDIVLDESEEFTCMLISLNKLSARINDLNCSSFVCLLQQKIIRNIEECSQFFFYLCVQNILEFCLVAADLPIFLGSGVLHILGLVIFSSLWVLLL